MADAPEPTRISAERGWTPPSIERMQEVLPAYEVIELLGAGGMGAVYKARQKSLKRLAAIKILPTAGADDDFQFVERFRNEAETLAQMNHPAIVNVYDFGETPNGLLYFVMEFVDGTDVHKMIQSSGKLSAEHALAITAHVCDALAYAHRMGVIHRDIKPANILINREGHVKVADFGLAKMQNPEQARGLTMSNMAMGTPDYAAPEVFKDVATVDHRADLYAVGVMLYQMLTGEVPRGFFKLPSEQGADPRFDAIIVKAMETNRDERYQSALEVRHALDEILTTPLAKNDGTGAISASAIPQRSRITPKPQPAPAPASSGKAKWLLATAVVAVLGGAGFFAMSGKMKPASVAVKPAIASPTTTPVATPAAKSGVIDLLPLVDVQRDALAGEWSRAGADLLVKAAKSGTDGSPRLQLPYQPPEEYDFEIEFTPESGGNKVVQILSAYQRAFTWQVGVKMNGGAKAGFDRIGGKSLLDIREGNAMRPSFLTTGQRHRSTVEVRRTGLRGLLDGQQIVAWGSKPESYQSLDIHPNDALRDALHLGLGGYDRAVRFHRITVREITGAGKVDATSAVALASNGANSESPPANIKWRDVTAEAREKAKVELGFGVDEQGIHKAGGGPNPRLMLTPPGQRDLAIFVRYTGQAQVDLRHNPAGFLYVIAQSNQVIFQSQASDNSPPVKLIPNQLHPPDFDTERPHELLVTLEGTRLRAWLDGRFVAEAKADTFTEGATGLMFSPKSVVHKVQLGELTTDTPEAK